MMIRLQAPGVPHQALAERTPTEVPRAHASANKPTFLATLTRETRSAIWNPVPGTLLSSKTVAVRSDGSKVTVGTVGPARHGQFARSVTFADGRQIFVLDAVSSRASIIQSPVRTAAFKQSLVSPPINCVTPGNTYQGEDSILGHSVAVVLRPPSGNVWTTVWLARDLGCEALKVQIASKEADGSLTLMTETNVISLTLGEPSPTLFDEAAGYVERKPSDIMKLYAEKIGVPATNFLEEGARADRSFSALGVQ